MDHTSLIRVESLRAGYSLPSGPFSLLRKVQPVVHDISFCIERGSTLALVGESGSGKSTLGRAIIGLIPVIEGAIHYQTSSGSLNLASLNEKEFRPLRSRIQMIFQDPYSSLNPSLRIYDILSESLHVHQPSLTKKELLFQTEKVLERVGLNSSIIHRYPHEFSGGQRQRISIARALILNPDFIICDECVSALDVSIQAQILNLLADIQEERGITYLFISHDLAVVRHISDRIAVMKSGRIIEEDESERLFHSPKTDYTRNLLSAILHPVVTRST